MDKTALLEQLKTLDFEQLIDLFIEAKTGSPLIAEDVLCFESLDYIEALAEEISRATEKTPGKE